MLAYAVVNVWSIGPIEQMGSGFFWLCLAEDDGEWTLAKLTEEFVYLIGSDIEYWRDDVMFKGAKLIGPLDVPDAPK